MYRLFSQWLFYWSNEPLLLSACCQQLLEIRDLQNQVRNYWKQLQILLVSIAHLTILWIESIIAYLLGAIFPGSVALTKSFNKVQY